MNFPGMGGPPSIGKIGSKIAPHVPTILMAFVIVFAVLFILIGIIVVSADKTFAGSALILLGMAMGAGAAFVIMRVEGGKKAAAAASPGLPA